jgi:hypothetical protein
MDAIGPDAVAPQDDLQEDLQAALAEIDKVSTESPATLEAPGDGLGQSGDAPPPDNPPSPSPESVESDPAEAAETLTAETDPTDAAEPTDDGPTTPVEPPDEMAAAAQQEDERPAETPIADGETASPNGPAPPSEQMPLEAEQPAAPVAELEPVSAEQPAASEKDDELANVTAPDGEVPTADSNDSPDSKSGLVDDQLSALFSEVEQDAGDAKPAPPEANLGVDDASGATAESESPDAEAPAPNEQPPDDNTEPVKPKAQDKKLRFKIGKKTTKPKAAASPPPAAPRKRKELPPAIQPTTSWGKRLFRVADEALDKVNRPFERMQERTKALVGCAALTTLIVSVLAMVAMPLILPHRDATMFLQEKRAALDAPPPSQETEEDDAPAPEND